MSEQGMQWIWLAITLAGIIVSGYLLMKVFRFEMQEFAKRISKETVLDPALLAWIEEISRGIRIAVIAMGAILCGFLVLKALGHPAVAQRSPLFWVDWFLDRGVRIVVILAAAYLTIKMARMIASRVALLIRPYDETPAGEMERLKRAQTVGTILEKFATVVIVAVTALMLLGELDVDTTPLLTSLGVVGVALGFGAQQLVKDLIAGFFHILENQIRVGDVAIINGTGGLVEEIHLRTTVLRGLDGTVHIFSNGNIQTLSNMTKDFSYFLMDLGVAYKEDTDRVCDVVREVVDGMQADEQVGTAILEPVEILGVDDFGDSAVTIKLRIKTLPIKQWEVGREFRRRLKYRFDGEGIEIPFPHRSIYFGEASKPFLVRGSGMEPLSTSQEPAPGAAPGR